MSPFKLQLQLLTFLVGYVVAKDGDLVEFYISARELPQSPLGTGSYYFTFQTGSYMHRLSPQTAFLWSPAKSSAVVEGANPIWDSDSDLCSVTELDQPGLITSIWRYSIMEVVPEPEGDTLIYSSVLHGLIPCSLKDSCRTGLPHDVFVTNSRGNFTVSLTCSLSPEQAMTTQINNNNGCSATGRNFVLISTSLILALRNLTPS